MLGQPWRYRGEPKRRGVKEERLMIPEWALVAGPGAGVR